MEEKTTNNPTNTNTFTQVPNDLLEVLFSGVIPLSGVRVLLYISRKTHGFHKQTDRISLTQFQNRLNLTRQTVVTQLEQLQLVKLVRLVSKGKSKRASNEWIIDISDYPQKLVKSTRHTKESITKERIDKSITTPVRGGNSDKRTGTPRPEVNFVLEEFSRIFQLAKPADQRPRQWAYHISRKLSPPSIAQLFVWAYSQEWGKKVSKLESLFRQIPMFERQKGGVYAPDAKFDNPEWI